MRRSGPWVLEKDRTCTTRSGSQAPSETSGAVLMAPEWSSSTTHGTGSTARSTRASDAARAGVVETPVGLWARGCSTIAAGRVASARRSDSGRTPEPVELDRHHLGAERLDQVVERREAGRLEDHAVAVRHDLLEHARDAVGGAVDDGERLGGGRPGGGERRGAARAPPAPRGSPGSSRARRPGAAPARAGAAAPGRGCRARGRGAGSSGPAPRSPATRGLSRGSAARGRRCRPARGRRPARYGAGPATPR